MNRVERVKALLQNPKSEWPVIEGEQHGIGYLFINYAAILAAIPPVAGFVGLCLTGYTGYRLNFLLGLAWALVVYALGLVSIFVMAYVIDALAGAFGGQRSFSNAMKVSVYAPPPPGSPAFSTSSRRSPFFRSWGSTASICSTPASPRS